MRNNFLTVWIKKFSEVKGPWLNFQPNRSTFTVFLVVKGPNEKAIPSELWGTSSHPLRPMS
jgi:hypothetical protein